jgi:hypothetical protein
MLRLRKILSFLALAGMAIIFNYGWFKYPDAPIQPCSNGGYCGKQGQPHSEKEYREFMVWQATPDLVVSRREWSDWSS